MYHDIISHDVFRSSDEGKTWNKIPDVPQGQALMVLDHPYDNKIVSTNTHPAPHAVRSSAHCSLFRYRRS